LIIVGLLAKQAGCHKPIPMLRLPQIVNDGYGLD